MEGTTSHLDPTGRITRREMNLCAGYDKNFTEHAVDNTVRSVKTVYRPFWWEGAYEKTVKSQAPK